MAAWIHSATGPMTTHFWGPIANWGLAGSGMYDAATKGPEIINERMCATQVLYSAFFARFGWQVAPRNYILTSCHVTNMAAQSNQLRRWAEDRMANGGEAGTSDVMSKGTMAAGVAAGVAILTVAGGPIQKSLLAGSGALKKVAEHPAGPFYIHFWAPNFKWALSINNLMDYDRPVEKISLSMNSALTLTGCLFMRWSFVITPVNYSLFFVNLALAGSSGYLLGRKVKADYM